MWQLQLGPSAVLCCAGTKITAERRCAVLSAVLCCAVRASPIQVWLDGSDFDCIPDEVPDAPEEQGVMPTALEVRGGGGGGRPLPRFRGDTNNAGGVCGWGGGRCMRLCV